MDNLLTSVILCYRACDNSRRQYKKCLTKHTLAPLHPFYYDWKESSVLISFLLIRLSFYQIIFEGLVGISWDSDIAIDDISFTDTPRSCSENATASTALDGKSINGRAEDIRRDKTRRNYRRKVKERYGCNENDVIWQAIINPKSIDTAHQLFNHICRIVLVRVRWKFTSLFVQYFVKK